MGGVYFRAAFNQIIKVYSSEPQHFMYLVHDIRVVHNR